MAKLQLLAITTLDGYLFDRTVSSPLWDNPNKYGLTKIRERATQTLGPDVSFISLTVGGRHSRCRPCHLLCRADAFALSGVPGRNQYATYGYEKNHADAAWLLRPEYQRTDA